MDLYDADGNLVDPSTLETPSVREQREHIKTLEAQLKEADTLKDRLAAMERGVAIKGAEVELNDVQMVALEAAHKGDWTPEAVRETAVQLGWAKPPDSGVPQGEIDQLGRINDAFTGANNSQPDPEAVIDSKLGQAKTEAEFMDIYRGTGRAIVS